MNPKDLAELLPKLGISPKLLAVVGVLALLVGVVAYVRAFWAKRKSRQADVPTASPEDGGGGPASVAPSQIRRAWGRFVRTLPLDYQRSILNFEHFVVLGGASSGKSRLIDGYTDWRRQAKQFLSSQPFDPDLQVYLGSGILVTELPSRILEDAGEACHRALIRLWRPLYRRRSPTAVVVVDAAHLSRSTLEERTDLAERIRGKINILSNIRKRPIQVRVVLTHLDEIHGWERFAAFCRDQHVALHISLPKGDSAKTPTQQIEAFFVGARGHLARALVTGTAADFREVVTFLRGAPVLSKPVGEFLQELFAREALSIAPISAGIYLACEPHGLPNPLRNAEERGPGPNPRTRHAVATGIATGLCLGYLVIAYVEQRSLWKQADLALADYQPSAAGTDAERQRRLALSEFLSHQRGILRAHPDFFETVRAQMRERVSRMLREELLVPRLRLVAQRGSTKPEGVSLPWRRALYYLALIHSDRHDIMHILDPRWLEVWAQMTELPADLLADYLRVTDSAYRNPVPFELESHAFDALDQVVTWTSFLADVRAALDHGSINKTDLANLRQRALELSESFDRFEYDEKTRAILEELDASANFAPAPGNAPAVHLRSVYEPKYERFLTNAATSDVFAQRDDLKIILRAVQDSSRKDVARVQLLATLTDQLAALYPDTVDPTINRTVNVSFGGNSFAFETHLWNQLLRDSRASDLISLFLEQKGEKRSIFFDTELRDKLRPIAWNPGNDGSVLLLGKAEIEPWYTRAGYDKQVHDGVFRLSDTLSRVNVPEETKNALGEMVSDQVRLYGVEYRNQLSHFYRAFSVRATSPQELRVVLSQMVADTSPFSDFMSAVDKQLSIATDHPWLAGMDEALSEFANLHKVLDGSGGSSELGKYKEILRQLLADLGATGEASPNVYAGAQTPSNQTLETALSPTGALVLKSVRSEKGSYASMISGWVDSVHLRDYQQVPFRGPLDQVLRVGMHDIESSVGRAWGNEVLVPLGHILEKYPFAKDAAQDATAQDLAFFDPQHGAFFDAFRRYFEPISDFGPGKPFRELPALHGRMPLPSHMYAIVNALAVLSGQLYDATGQARLLDVRLSTVPFDHGVNPRAALTLAYLNVSDVSVFNFNQKPGVTTLKFDWTREQPCQIGVQLTDLDTKENKFPQPLAVDTSYWSLFHLLDKAEAPKPVIKGEGKSANEPVVYTWTISQEQTPTRVRFALFGDPLEMFTRLSTLVKESQIARTGKAH